jgi:hypothetical protein
MKKVKINGMPSANSSINKSFGKIDYQDGYYISIHNSHNYSIDYLTGLFFTSSPEWINKLLIIRNFIVSFFGLKGGIIDKTKQPTPSVYYPKDSKVGIFNVYDRNDHEIIMAEDDEHLNFRTSVIIEKTTDTDMIQLYSSTIVHYNNIWGRLYFLLVRPFHQLIVKISLKVLAKKIEKREK